MPHPQNGLRNVAKSACQAPFIMTVDIDMIPMSKMYQKLNRFLSQPQVVHCDKCAYVIPLFEIEVTERMYFRMIPLHLKVLC